MANAMIIKSSAAGKMGPAATEVFNDYNNNKAGIKGYYFTKFIINNDGTGLIYLSTIQTAAPTEERDLDFDINYIIGDIISYVSGSKYYDSATITSIDDINKTIAVTPVDGVTLKVGDYGTDIDDQILFVYAKPLNGIVHLGHYAHAEGENNIVAERAGHAEGRQTVVRGQYGHAEGRLTEAWYCGHAEGRQTKAKGFYSHAEGFNTRALGGPSYGGHTEGFNTEAANDNTHAEGEGTKALGVGSHAEGFYTVAAGQYQHVEGKHNRPDTENKYIHIAGNGTGGGGEKNAYTLDWDGNGWFAGNVSVGTGKEILITENSVNTKIAKFPGIKSGTNEIFNDYEGNSVQRTVINEEDGTETIINGQYSHVEGKSNNASGRYAHAEGLETKAYGDTAHAEGIGTTAGSYSHAEGFRTKAMGSMGSHAEGWASEANGDSSHAENRSIANGTYSHAEGYLTTANGDCQHVQGRRNIVDNENKYLHIVGNGGETSGSESNAHTLDWDGNAWFAGTVETTGIVLKSPNGTKWLVTIDNEGNLITTQK